MADKVTPSKGFFLGKMHILVVGLVLFMASLSFGKETAKLPFPNEIKDSLPWFAVFELQNENRPFTRATLLNLGQKNERVALVYYATWCIPCRVGLKQISQNKDALAAAKTSVVLVNVGEREKASIMKFLSGVSLAEVSSVTDPFGRLSVGFGLVKEGETMVLPRTIIVDKRAKPVMLLGEEGDDYIRLLKGE